MKVIEYENGLLINGDLFNSSEVFDYIKSKNIKATLQISDPPYAILNGVKNYLWEKTKTLSQDLVNLLKKSEDIIIDGGSIYCYGCFGSPNNRPFFDFIVNSEKETRWQMSSFITLNKKKAFGVKHRYLPTVEHCAHFILGEINKPAIFNIPYTNEKRTCDSFNPKYQCKSDYKRRTMVWDDFTGFEKKEHYCQKPAKISKIIIEASSNEGDYVLDFFSGSGECAVEAVKLNRKFISVEYDKEQFEFIKSKFDKEFGIGKEITC